MKKYFYLLSVTVALGLGSCQPAGTDAGPASTESEAEPAQAAVDAAIATHGVGRVVGRRIEFDFRGRHYVSDRQRGRFTYERIFTDSAGRQVRDVLSNTGLFREINGRRQTLPAEDSAAYARSVNSVIYFALLPYYLNDAAVRKEYLGEVEIKGEPYHKVKVTFEQEGGGRDYEDEYVYWFHRDRHTMDFLAYNYIVDGGGARFREAYNIRTVDGIRFADYANFQPREERRDVETFDSLYQNGGLEELSRIETENVQVLTNEGNQD